MIRRRIAVLALVVLGGCGGGDGPTGPASVTSITIAAPSQLLSAIGETITMSATGKTAKGAAVGNLTFTWSSSNPGVATVANGLVTAIGNGSTTISAAVGSATGSVQLSVQQTASQVTVTFATDTIRAIGDTARAIAAARDSRGNPITGQTVTWTSGNPAVVTVDGNGLMTAIAEGSAIVRGVSGSAQGERTMQVRQRAARLIFLRQPSPARAGVAFTIQPQGELQDARGNRVSTDNATVVTASVGGTGGGGTVVSGATATANGGVVTFTVLAIGGPVGLKVLQLQAPSTSTASSEAFALSAGNPSTVIAASGNAQNGLAGNALPQPLVAGVRDAFGNPVAGVDMNFTVTQGTGTVNPAQAVTDANGNAATNHTLSRYAGNSTVTGASATVPSAQAQFTAVGAPNGVIRGTITGSGAALVTVANAAVRGGGVHRRLTGYAANIQPPAAVRTKPARAPLPAATQPTPATATPTDPYVPGELLVTYRANGIGAPAMGAQAYRQATAVAQVRMAIEAAIAPTVGEGDVTLVSVSPATLTARLRLVPGANETQVIESLRRDARVQAVERNYIMTTHRVTPTAMQEFLIARGLVGPPPVSLQSLLTVPFALAAMINTYPGGGVYPGNSRYVEQSWHYNIIQLPLAWTVTTGSPSVLIAVVDDGIRFDHPAMAGVLTNDGFDFVSSSSAPLCAGGSIDVTGDGDGYDSNPTQPSSRSPSGNCLGGVNGSGNHGLHVSGTIGAIRNNSSGVVGVNWQARIRPVRVMSIAGSGTNYDIAQGVLYAAGLPADNGIGGTVTAAGGPARVINMSLGGSSPSVVMANAVQAAFINGSLIIASAGNSNNATPNYPASYPEPVSVAAVAPSLARASYSSYGANVDIAAPGGDVSFGATHGVYSSTWNFQNGTPIVDSWQGTSMAAPHVTGMAALLLSREPGLTPAQLKARLINYTIDLGAPGWDQFFGTGLVNMVNILTATTVPPRTLFVRLVNATTGATVQTVTAGVGGTFGFTGLPDGPYWVFAGVDEYSDGIFGVPMRPWGALGSAAAPTSVVVDGAGLYAANFALAGASELEPNDTPEGSDELLPDGYMIGTFSGANDVDFFRLRIRVAGNYLIEAVGHVGACGWAVEADPILTLFTAGGTQLSTNDDIDYDNNDYCSRLSGTLPVGDYLVRLSGYGSGRYAVSVRRQ